LNTDFILRDSWMNWWYACGGSLCFYLVEALVVEVARKWGTIALPTRACAVLHPKQLSKTPVAATAQPERSARCVAAATTKPKGALAWRGHAAGSARLDNAGPGPGLAAAFGGKARAV
jgi:hypothetical protein